MNHEITDPKRYVQENKETLVRIIKHGDDEFTRALALAAIIRYGDGPLINDIENEVSRAKHQMGADA